MKLGKTLVAFALFPSLGLVAVADSGADHQTTQTRPVSRGTSGGNLNEFFTCPEGTYCSSGTLGALVKDADGKLYILSNYHVLSRTEGSCIAGDTITQPGSVDAGCSLNSSSGVAVLTECVSLNFSGGNNTADAAIAEIVTGAVDPAGSILDIGQPSTTTVAPKTRMRVKKSDARRA